jgi:hypothetical protein
MSAAHHQKYDYFEVLVAEWAQTPLLASGWARLREAFLLDHFR